MKPELIIEARNMSLIAIGILNSTKNLIVDLEFLTVVARIWMRRLHRSASAAFNVMLNHHHCHRARSTTVLTEEESERERDREKLKEKNENERKRRGKGKVKEKIQLTKNSF